MVFTDYGLSTIRSWIGGVTVNSPSGMILGTGSNTPSFGDLFLGSPLDPTRHEFSSASGIGFTAQVEHLVISGDITTGSVTREVGMIEGSGGQVWTRSLMPEIELFGSAEINTFLLINIS